MSGHGGAKKTLATRAVQALALAVAFGVLFSLTHFTSEIESRLGTMTAIGFLVLAGTLLSELLEPIGLPHLSGYLLAGIVGGPHMLHLVDHETVAQLSPKKPEAKPAAKSDTKPAAKSDAKPAAKTDSKPTPKKV